MSGSGSKERKRAIALDVDSWVNYAGFSGDKTNPYDQTDKRHGMFASKLARESFISEEFLGMNEIHGGDNSQLKLRPYPKPNLVPIELLGPPRIERK